MYKNHGSYIHDAASVHHRLAECWRLMKWCIPWFLQIPRDSWAYSHCGRWLGNGWIILTKLWRSNCWISQTVLTIGWNMDDEGIFNNGLDGWDFLGRWWGVWWMTPSKWWHQCDIALLCTGKTGTRFWWIHSTIARGRWCLVIVHSCGWG